MPVSTEGFSNGNLARSWTTTTSGVHSHLSSSRARTGARTQSLSHSLAYSLIRSLACTHGPFLDSFLSPVSWAPDTPFFTSRSEIDGSSNCAAGASRYFFTFRFCSRFPFIFVVFHSRFPFPASLTKRGSRCSICHGEAAGESILKLGPTDCVTSCVRASFEK